MTETSPSTTDHHAGCAISEKLSDVCTCGAAEQSLTTVHKQHTDIHGKPYLTVAEAKAGMQVAVDEGFTCIRPRSLRVIEQDESGLFIPCRQGKHHLDGQLSDDGMVYVGVYPR